MEAFIKARLKWLQETLCVLGLILIVGFVRVNFFGATINLTTPEYKTHTILGSELPKTK